MRKVVSTSGISEDCDLLYHDMLRQQKLLTVDAFRVQVWFGKYIFLAFFAGFSPGLT